MEHNALEWNDVRSLVRRNRKPFFMIFCTIFISSIVIAFTLPPIYRAETTIFIEEQQIPESYVGSTITNYAEERISSIRQQVFNSDRLKNIIETYNLYPEIREKFGMVDAISKMREAINMEPNSANYTNRATGKNISATIAFILSFEGRDPETVQKITNVLSDLFLEEDSLIKERMTTATTEFLSTESEALKEELQEYDRRISEFKKRHFGELPEHSAVNLSNIGRLEREYERVAMQIRDLQDQKKILEGQLASVDPLLSIQIDGENVARNPSERLKYLRLQLISRQSVLHDTHPDIAKLKREIEELENKAGVSGSYQGETKRLVSLKAELAGMEGNYGPKHPDVIKLNEEIKILEKSIESKVIEGRSRNMSMQVPDNPVYINLVTQISSVTASIGNLTNDMKNIQEELSEYRKRIEKSPTIEREYNELTRDYKTKTAKYDEIMNNLIAANFAKGVEEGQHGQRFEIKNYAYLPGKPYKPNRIAILMIGFILASSSGIGFTALKEFFDKSIKTEKDLERLFGLEVLTVISKVETRKEKIKKNLRRLAFAFAVFSFVLIGAKIINDYVVPINELLLIIQRNTQNIM